MSSPLAGSAVIRSPSATGRIAGAGSRVGVVLGTDRRDALLSSVTAVGNKTYWVAIWSQGGEHGIDGILGLTMNDVELPASAVVRHYYGKADQGVDEGLAEVVSGYDDNLVSVVNGHSVALAYSVIRLSDAPGIPRFSATIRGLKLYDPRTDVIAYTDNAAICTAALIESPVFGMGRSVLDLPEAADYCDELFDSERRCRVGLSVGYDQEPPRQRIDNLAEYAQCYVVPVGADRKLKPKIYREPIATLFDSDISDHPVFSVPDIDKVPSVWEIGFTDTQSVPWRDHPGVRATIPGVDTGQVQEDIESASLTGIQWPNQAKRVVARRRAQSLLGESPIELKVTGSAFGLERGDNIELDLADIAGEFLIDEIRYDDDAGSYRLTVVSESVENYPDILPGDLDYIELLTPPFVPRSDSAEEPNIAGVFSGGGVYIEGADGTIHNRIRVDLATPSNQISFGYYEVRFRRLGSAEPWQDASVTGYTAFLEPVQEGAEYEFDYRIITKQGGVSGWKSATHTVKAKDVPPGNIDGVTVTVNAMGVRKIDIEYLVEPNDLGGFRIEYSGGAGYFDLLKGLTKKRVIETSEMPSGNVTVRVRAEDNTIHPVTGLRNASDWKYVTTNITQDADGIWYDVDNRITVEQNRNDGQDGDLVTHDGRISTENVRNNGQDGSLTSHDGRISTESTRNNGQDSNLVSHDGRISTESGRNNGQDTSISYESGRNNTQDSDLSVKGTQITTERNRNNTQDSSLVTQSGQISTESSRNNTQDNDLSVKGSQIATEQTRNNGQDSSISSQGSQITTVSGTAGTALNTANSAQNTANSAQSSAGSAWTQGVNAYNLANGVKGEFDAVKSILVTTQNLYAQNITANQITGGTITGTVSASNLYLRLQQGGQLTMRDVAPWSQNVDNDLSTINSWLFGGAGIDSYIEGRINTLIAAHVSSLHVGGGGN